MVRSFWLRGFVMGWCAVTLVLPAPTRAADQGVLPGLVRDISLQSDGSLRGALVNAEGQPQAGNDVVLLKGLEVVGVAKTEKDGSFAIRSVSPGLYELASEKSGGVYRVWTPRAAPPAAKPSAMLVESSAIVRGQEWSPMRRALILSGIIITSGVIGGVIGYNIKEDDSAS